MGMSSYIMDTQRQVLGVLDKIKEPEHNPQKLWTLQ